MKFKFLLLIFCLNCAFNLINCVNSNETIEDDISQETSVKPSSDEAQTVILDTDELSESTNEDKIRLKKSPQSMGTNSPMVGAPYGGRRPSHHNQRHQHKVFDEVGSSYTGPTMSKSSNAAPSPHSYSDPIGNGSPYGGGHGMQHAVYNPRPQPPIYPQNHPPPSYNPSPIRYVAQPQYQPQPQPQYQPQPQPQYQPQPQPIYSTPTVQYAVPQQQYSAPQIQYQPIQYAPSPYQMYAPPAVTCSYSAPAPPPPPPPPPPAPAPAPSCGMSCGSNLIFGCQPTVSQAPCSPPPQASCGYSGIQQIAYLPPTQYRSFSDPEVGSPNHSPIVTPAHLLPDAEPSKPNNNAGSSSSSSTKSNKLNQSQMGKESLLGAEHGQSQSTSTSDKEKPSNFQNTFFNKDDKIDLFDKVDNKKPTPPPSKPPPPPPPQPPTYHFPQYKNSDADNVSNTAEFAGSDKANHNLNNNSGQNPNGRSSFLNDNSWGI